MATFQLTSLRSNSRTAAHALLCAAVSLTHTGSRAEPTPIQLAFALKTSPKIVKRQARTLRARPPEPLPLKVSVEIGAFSEAPVEFAEPFPLRLSYAIGTARDLLTRDESPLPIDVALAEPVFYAIRVNGEERGDARLLRLPDGRWLARRADLEEWRLRIPDSAKPALYRGEEYFVLDAYPGLDYKFDDARQALTLEFPPRFFVQTQIEGTPSRAARAAPPSPGGFANYDLFWNAAEESKRLGGLFEAGFFNRFGVGTTSFVATNETSQARLVRLETTWTRDFPDQMKTLTLGDTIGSSGIWGRPVRFGGVRFGTNFATNPGFVTFPLPGLRGEAALPTTTELYVNGVLRQSGSVPPGPFHINNLPVITGQGDVRLVVRDLLGREQVINVPYYTTAQLLRAGLSDESNEIGLVREDFGLRSNDYGRPLLALQRRRGFSDQLTGEARAELLRDQQTLGGGGSVSFPSIGVFTGAGAVSHSDRGVGELLFTGFERQVLNGVSFGARSQWATDKFAQLGLPPELRAPSRVMTGSVGFSPGFGSLGVSYIRQDNRDLPGTEIVAASYSATLGKGSALVVTAFKPLNGIGTTAVSVTLSMGFGERTSGLVSYTGQAHANEAIAQIQQNLPPGSGFGYRVLAGKGTNGVREEVGLSMQTATGTYSVEAGHALDRTSYRASASGGVAVLDGRPFLTRTVSESFGVAHVPGFSNVGVFVNNQLVSRTDERGYALLPRLLPYQGNPVRIEVADLPLDARIGGNDIDAVPYFRSGVFLSFPVDRAFGALVELRLEDGQAMPAGSIVRVVGRDEEFPVADRGEAYLTGLQEKNRIRVSWRDESCELDLELGTKLGSQPRIGPLTCAGVKR